ncbi:MAG: hypothetical protein ACI8TP_004714 [Acidimicrobiales bacterium]|jgi:hypothetical protein
MRLFTNKKRPVHLGPYPLERLPRLSSPNAAPLGLDRSRRRPTEPTAPGPTSANSAYQLYVEMFNQQRTGEKAPEAPIPDDLTERSNNIKAGLYFLDADMVGTAVVPDGVGDPKPRVVHRARRHPSGHWAPQRRPSTPPYGPLSDGEDHPSRRTDHVDHR